MGEPIFSMETLVGPSGFSIDHALMTYIVTVHRGFLHLPLLIEFHVPKNGDVISMLSTYFINNGVVKWSLQSAM